MQFATAATATAHRSILADERTEAEARITAGKRYRGRAADLRRIAELDVAITALHTTIRDLTEAEQAARLTEEEEAYNPLASTREAFRRRVAERAYYLGLAGWGSSDVERWLWAETLQRAAEATPKAFTRHAGLDYYEEKLYRH